MLFCLRADDWTSMGAHGAGVRGGCVTREERVVMWIISPALRWHFCGSLGPESRVLGEHGEGWSVSAQEPLRTELPTALCCWETLGCWKPEKSQH